MHGLINKAETGDILAIIHFQDHKAGETTDLETVRAFSLYRKSPKHNHDPIVAIESRRPHHNWKHSLLTTLLTSQGGPHIPQHTALQTQRRP